MTSWLLWRSIIPCCQHFQKTVTKGGKTVLRAAPWLQRQTRQRVEHRRKHINYCHVPHLDSWVTTTIIFSSEVNIFLTITPAYLGNFLILSLLPLTGKLRFIYRPNSCIVVWQRLILAYYSASCCYWPCFTNIGVFVDTPGMESTYQEMHYIEFLWWHDDHKRGQTSRLIVGAEIQRNRNFEEHLYHYSCLLDSIHCRRIIFHFTYSNNSLV